MRLVHRLLAGLLTAGLSLTLLAPPAHAETRTITDRRGDGSSGAPGNGGPRKYGDIGTVRIKHGVSKVYFRVFAAKGGRVADFYDLWVDTNVHNPGPEFDVSFSLETERASVSQTDRFGSFGRRLPCRIDRAEWVRQGIRVVIPRSCLRTPGYAVAKRIRVAVQTSQEYGNADWAPGVRTFGPFITSGAG